MHWIAALKGLRHCHNAGRQRIRIATAQAPLQVAVTNAFSKSPLAGISSPDYLVHEAVIGIPALPALQQGRLSIAGNTEHHA